VAKGYSQVEGLDFGETYAPVARLESICILLAYATYHGGSIMAMMGSTSEKMYLCQVPNFGFEMIKLRSGG
jgi:hypothetical protein